MKCIICNSQMRIYSAGEKWTYWKCSKCHFYATSANEKNIDFAMDYDEYETFDAETEYEKNVKYTKKLLQYKFDLIKYIPNSFLDYGCSEGCFVEAFSKINPGGTLRV